MENHLPLDLIIQILCRLPAKSLFRFTCVSKQWASLIKDKTFIKLHLHQSTKTNSLVSIHCIDGKILLMDLKSRFTTEAIPPFNDFGRLRLMGTFNGLIGLIFFSDWDSHDLFWEDDIVLWNISTREHLVLPKVPNYSNNDNYGRYKMFGFGYDSNNDDYKVIKIFETLDLDIATIYSLRSKSWGKINRCTSYETFGKIGVYVSSAFHWLASDNKIMFILAYNINTEKQQILQLPDRERFEFVPKKVGVLGEDLYVLNYRFWPDFVEIWVMKEYGVKESWTRLLTIHNGEVDLRENLYSYPCCFKNGDEELLVVAEDYLVYYNLRNKSFRRVPNNPELGKALMYHQSLISINESSGTAVVGERRRMKRRIETRGKRQRRKE